MVLVFSFGIVHSPFLVFIFPIVNRSAPPAWQRTQTTFCKKHQLFLIKIKKLTTLSLHVHHK